MIAFINTVWEKEIFFIIWASDESEIVFKTSKWNNKPTKHRQDKIKKQSLSMLEYGPFKSKIFPHDILRKVMPR